MNNFNKSLQINPNYQVALDNLNDLKLNSDGWLSHSNHFLSLENSDHCYSMLIAAIYFQKNESKNKVDQLL